MAGAELLTLPECSRALGLDRRGRRLRRLLIAHERVSGVTVGVRLGDRPQAQWRVSMAAAREVLRSHGLLSGGDRLDRLGRQVRENLAGLDERIDARSEVVAVRVVGRARSELEARDEQVMADVVEVSRALRRVAIAAGVAGAMTVKPRNVAANDCVAENTQGAADARPTEAHGGPPIRPV